MKKLIILANLICVTSLSAMGFDFQLGPFNMQFGIASPLSKEFVDTPICYAISHQNQLEIIVVGKERPSPNEIKITSKRIVIEPYAFGFNSDRQPILEGNLVEAEMLKEVSIKYGEKNRYQKKMDDDQESFEHEKEGFFSGFFKSRKSKSNFYTVDIRQVKEINVIENSHFEIPKNFDETFKDEMEEVVCQIPSLKLNLQPSAK